jgi:hypothetical protein
MKKLALLFGLVAFSVNAQIKVGKCQSYYADKQLAKQIFDSINAYRKSLGQEPYVWEENYYVTAKKQNDYLADNGLWGHRINNVPGTELIVAVNNLRVPINSDMYSMLADSCLRQWKHSEFHHETLKTPILSKSQTSSTITVNNVNLNVLLCKYGAISVNVLDYGNVKHISCILHLGYYVDTNKWLER